MFSITSSNVVAIVIVTPALGEVIVEGTQNYQITWTGANIAAMKTLMYSLNNGVTWDTIGVINANVFAYSWSVPDTTSTQAVVRIIDGNGITGKSGIFTITKKPNPGSIVIVKPATGEMIAGGKVNYQIVFTATNVTAPLTLEYSLDGGQNWTLIGVIDTEGASSFTWARVPNPNVTTTDALVRIIDNNGVTGTSGLFTITFTQGVGSINSITLSGLDGNNNIGNNKTLGISWAFTPPIGTSDTVEYSLDNKLTWNNIGTVPVTTPSPNSTTWQTTAMGYYSQVYIRITSSDDLTATSIRFSIGSNASVASDAAMNGYSVSNYPNPASSQTTINFVLPVESDVTVTITDELGRAVGTIVNERFGAGTYTVPFNTSQLMPGVYAYMLQAGNTRIVGRMNIIK